MRPTLSLCMIVRNEAENLPRSLGSVHDLFDDLVVLDTGSTDETLELAASYGARVFETTWPGDFAQARNQSIQEARGDWIMWLDADNQVSPQGLDLIRGRLDHDRRTIFWCTEVVVPAGERLIQKRVFPRRPEVRFEGRVHEQLVHPKSFASVYLPVEIRHWGYADGEAGRAKGLRNLALLQEMAAESPGDFYVQYQLGRTQLNLRHFREALSALESALAASEARRTSPGLYLHAFILKHQVLERLDRLEEAEQTLKELCALAPDYGPGQYHLGRLLYRRGLFEDAAARLKRYLEFGTGDPTAGFNPHQMSFTAAMLIARALEALDRPEEAVRFYGFSAGVNPQNPEPHLAQARLSLARGDRREAGGHLQRCLKLAPDNPRALRLLDEVGLDAG